MLKNAKVGEAILREWRAIKQLQIRRRISEMPQRCRTLCQNSGDRIKSDLWWFRWFLHVEPAFWSPAQWIMEPLVRVILRRWERAFQKVEMNWEPRSEIMSSGQPWRLYTVWRKRVMSSSASREAHGMKCRIFIRRSIMTRTCLYVVPSRSQLGRPMT